MKLFTFNPYDRVLGHVNHHYDRRNPYHVVGNFFIGIGPILLGALVMYGSSRYLLGPDLFVRVASVVGTNAFLMTNGVLGLSKDILAAVWVIVSSVASVEQLTSWKFYAWIYLTFTVGSSIRLSGPDVKDALDGLGFFVGMLFAFNLLSRWIGDFADSLFLDLSRGYAAFYVVMLFAILLNAIVGALFFLLRVCGRATRTATTGIRHRRMRRGH